MASRSLRFDDVALQERFLADLLRGGVPHRRTDDGTVECSDTEWSEVNDVAHKVRDSCFRWYFSWFDSPEESSSFLTALRNSDLPFQLEHHEKGSVFLLAKLHEDDYINLLSDS